MEPTQSEFFNLGRYVYTKHNFTSCYCIKRCDLFDFIFCQNKFSDVPFSESLVSTEPGLQQNSHLSQEPIPNQASKASSGSAVHVVTYQGKHSFDEKFKHKKESNKFGLSRSMESQEKNNANLVTVPEIEKDDSGIGQFNKLVLITF